MSDITSVYTSMELIKGLELVDRAEFAKAYHFFEALNERKPNNPVTISFLGYLTASYQQKPYQGLEMCLKSIQNEQENPLVYLNLAKVYVQLNDRYHAVQAVMHGLKYDSSPFRQYLVNYYKFLGIRQKTAMPFLRRSNPINKFVGKIMKSMKRGK